MKTMWSRAFGVAVVTLSATWVVACVDEDEMPEVRHPVGSTSVSAANSSPAPTIVAMPQEPATVGGADPEDPPGNQGEEGATDQPEPDEADDADPSSLTEFHSTLDPYGTWNDDPTYGYVWTPSPDAVGQDFTPYVSSGHWLYDDSDYVWASDYSWGWAPFHYGRWVFAPNAGWEWVPGRTYAGAWVSWRYGGGGYVGWAPLAPTWGWRRGVAVGVGFVPVAPYSFVATGHLFAPALQSHLVNGPQVRAVAQSTRPWTSSGTGSSGRSYAGGPPPSVLHVAAPQMGDARDPGVDRARAFAQTRTSSSSRMGMPSRGSASPQMARPNNFSSWHEQSRPAEDRASHFGGRLGAGFVGSQPLAPAYGGAPRPYFGDRTGVHGSSVSSGGASVPRAMPSQGAARVAPSRGGFGGTPGGGASAPPAAHFSGGGYHGGGGGGFHGGGGGGGHGGGRR